MSAIKSSWNPQHYAKHADFVPALGGPLIALLNPQPYERILDLGCGDGVLTEKLMQASCQVEAIDSSPEMVEVARQRGIEAWVMSGENMNFNNRYDAVFSNAALHWMRRPELVIAGVQRALKPGGRFVAEMGGAGNVQTIVAALETALMERGMKIHNPWFFPTEADYCAILTEVGMRVDSMQLFKRPTILNGTVSGWLRTFSRPFTQEMNDAETEAFIEEVTQALAPKMMNEQGLWQADYVRLRFVAYKK